MYSIHKTHVYMSTHISMHMFIHTQIDMYVCPHMNIHICMSKHVNRHHGIVYWTGARQSCMEMSLLREMDKSQVKLVPGLCCDRRVPVGNGLWKGSLLTWAVTVSLHGSLNCLIEQPLGHPGLHPHADSHTWSSFPHSLWMDS